MKTLTLAFFAFSIAASGQEEKKIPDTDPLLTQIFDVKPVGSWFMFKEDGDEVYYNTPSQCVIRYKPTEITASASYNHPLAGPIYQTASLKRDTPSGKWLVSGLRTQNTDKVAATSTLGFILSSPDTSKQKQKQKQAVSAEESNKISKDVLAIMLSGDLIQEKCLPILGDLPPEISAALRPPWNFR